MFPGHDAAIGSVDVQAVGEHRPAANQAEAIVDVEVAPAIGELPRDLVHLLGVLGEMGVDPDVRMLGGQPARRLELSLTRRQGKARRDGIAEPALPVPALDQRLAVGIGARRRIA